MATTASDSEALPLPVIDGHGAPLAGADAAAVRAALEADGALLLRGFATTLEGFSALGSALCTTSLFNESPNRELLGEGGSVQSVNLGADPFPLHPELAREPWRPDLAMFACLDAPGVGGQTNICDGIAIADNLPDALRAELAGKRLFYIRPASPELLEYWLGTGEPSDALLAAPPPSCPYWFRRAQGRILRGFTRPVLEPTLFQGRPAFANFLLFARDYLGIDHVPLLEGKPFTEDMVDAIRAVARRLTYSHRWRDGDVLLLDNSRFMHGRKAIADAPKRRIATYFGYLKGIDRREGEPEDPVWRRESFVPPEKPHDS
ncbi:MAG TPA: TauD/TfdA family dioxygenase [Croceibacterium sp.]|nr:TauD/TfdA family dioxygenase [Croceibacterium sp.]